MDTLESLRSQTEGAEDLKSVVSAMKAMAGSNIIQYETAVSSLGDYYHTIALGIIGYFKAQGIESIASNSYENKSEKVTCAIVFGSDQGLVAQFNDSMATFVIESLKEIPGKTEIWVVGERVQLLLTDEGFNISAVYPVPGEINAVTPLITKILSRGQERSEEGDFERILIFHNQPKPPAGYIPVVQRLLPLDEKWKNTLQQLAWPTKLPPQVMGGAQPTLAALIKAYLFTSLFRACVESLASENASRLEAMQRAEKNISDLLEDLGQKYHRLRQSSIDEELFDVISGFEALKKEV